MPKNYQSDYHLTPEVRKLLKKINKGTPTNKLPVNEARQSLKDLQKSVNVDMSGIEIDTQDINTKYGTVPTYIVKPKGNPSPEGVFLFIHGGGWVLGSFEDHKRLVRDLVVESNQACIFPQYSLSPEARYPTALNQIQEVISHFLKYGKEHHKLNMGNFAIVGNSAGGNMSIATVYNQLKIKGATCFKCLVAMWPVTDKPDSFDSWKEYGVDRYLTKDSMEWFWNSYLTYPAKEYKEHDVVVNQASALLYNFPPTQIHVAENDILRDEGESFGMKLALAGVDAVTLRYNGVIHDWGLLNPLAEIPQTKELIRSSSSFLNKYI